MKSLIFSFLAACLCAAPALAAAHGPVGGGSSSVGVPNPAARYCNDNGGESVLVTEAAGEFAFCKIGDALIEEWTLMNGADGQAVKLFLNPVDAGPLVGNPAWDYCSDNGGTPTSVALVANAGESVDYCKFADNTAIELWTLFRGPNDSGNAALADVLRGAHGDEPVTLGQLDSAWLFDRLKLAGVEADHVVGAETYRARQITCQRIIVPGMPTACSIVYGEGAVESVVDGPAGQQLMGIIQDAVGLNDPVGLVGASHVLARDVMCSKPVVPGGKPHCELKGPTH